MLYLLFPLLTNFPSSPCYHLRRLCRSLFPTIHAEHFILQVLKRAGTQPVVFASVHYLFNSPATALPVLLTPPPEGPLRQKPAQNVSGRLHYLNQRPALTNCTGFNHIHVPEKCALQGGVQIVDNVLSSK